MAAFPDIRRSLPTDASVTAWRAPDGWEHRRFDWPAPAGAARGSILFSGGRGDVFEKYLESFAHWHAQGWHVSSFDWRGQGGSGRCSPDARCGHVERFGDFYDDMQAFWHAWRQGTPGPHVAIGHSMGGFLVLRCLVDARIDPVAAVLVAPMLGLKGPFGAGVGERLAHALRRLGDPARSAWKGNERPATTTTRQALLTHDLSRYEDELHWQAANPANVTGPPSWTWVAEAFTETRLLREDARVAALETPVLGLIADADGLVDARAAHGLLARIPSAQVVRFGREAAHELLREADPVRDRALGTIDTFLDARAPA